MAIQSLQFFKDARRSGLCPNVQGVHKSSVTRARSKISWRAFEDIFYKAVAVAHEILPELPSYLWHGMSVYGIDGSKYTLPATDEIREALDPTSGFQNKGKGHFPQCLVSTVFDVFRRLPVGRTISPVDTSERTEAAHLISHIPKDGVLLFDRGYPGYELIQYLLEKYSGYFLFRCPASSTFAAVQKFIESGLEEDIIWILPSSSYKSKVDKKKRGQLKPIKLRVVRLCNGEGTLSVLLTNLYDRKKYPIKEIIELYRRRWEVENYYRDEKVTMDIEQFHSKTVNGIKQEIFAAAIMSVIARTLMFISAENKEMVKGEPQFKNAVMVLAKEAILLTPDCPEKAVNIFSEILEMIYMVKYYRPKFPRPVQPRVNKRPINKWCNGRSNKCGVP